MCMIKLLYHIYKKEKSRRTLMLNLWVLHAPRCGRDITRVQFHSSGKKLYLLSDHYQTNVMISLFNEALSLSG